MLVPCMAQLSRVFRRPRLTLADIGRKLAGTHARNLQNMQRNHQRDKKNLAKTNKSSYKKLQARKKQEYCEELAEN